MTGTEPPSNDPQPSASRHLSGQVVSTQLSRLERKTARAWGILIFGLLFCLWVHSLDSPLTYAAPFLALIVLAVSINGLKRSQDGIVLPPIADGLGLTVDRDKHRFLDLVPSRMFPKRHSVTVSTIFHGTFEDRVIWLADATSNDGDGTSSDDFHGLLVQLDKLQELPDFLMVPVAWTKRGWLGIGSTIDSTGFTRLQFVPVADRQYDLMTPSGSSRGIGLAQASAILADFGRKLPRGVHLYSAQARSGVLNVALFSRKGLLSGGGLFFSSQAMFAGAESAESLLAAGLELGKTLARAGKSLAA
jgi:hypothetical protein